MTPRPNDNLESKPRPVASEIFPTRRTSAGATAAIAVVIGVTAWGFGLFGRDISVETRIVMILGGSLAGVIAWRDALVRIRLDETALVAEYILRSRVIPYADIVDLCIEDEVPLGIIGGGDRVHKDVLVIHRRRGISLVLRNFDDDIATPFAALQRRWSMATEHGEQRAVSPAERASR